MFPRSAVMSVRHLKGGAIFLLPFPLSHFHPYIQFLTLISRSHLCAHFLEQKRNGKKADGTPACRADRESRDRRVNFVECRRTRRGHDRPVFRQREGRSQEEKKRVREKKEVRRAGESSFSTTAPLPRNGERGCGGVLIPSRYRRLLSAASSSTIFSSSHLASSTPHSILRHPLASHRSTPFSLARASRRALHASLALALPVCARCDTLRPFFPALLRSPFLRPWERTPPARFHEGVK